MFEAWYVSGNQVLVKQPGCPYAYMKGTSEESKGKLKVRYDEDRNMERDAVVRNDFIGDADLKFKYTLLEFEEESNTLGFNNQTFSPNSENNKITGVPAPSHADFTIKTATGVKTVSSYRCTIMWDIAIAEKKTRYVTASQPKKNEFDALITAAFNSMLTT